MTSIIYKNKYKEFDLALKQSRLFPIKATSIDILQINFGKLCNQTCKHCHVEAGPSRTEIISKKILDSCYNVIKNT